MGLENTKLPGFVIADLYKSTLIGDQEASVSTVEAKEKEASAGQAPAIEKPATTKKKPVEEIPPTERTVAKKTIPAEPGVYRALGSNGKNISILVDFTNEPFLPDAHLQFLTKMLDACKLNLGDVAIINVAAAPVEIEQLKKQLAPNYVLLFGVEPVSVQLPFRFPHFKEQEYAGSHYLFVPGLDELNVDTEQGKLLKSKLWVCLRKLFNV